MPTVIRQPSSGSIFTRTHDYSTLPTPLPPRRARLERFLHGFAQPLLAANVLRGDSSFRIMALRPVLLFFSVCCLLAVLDREALVHGGNVVEFLSRLYVLMVALAPAPPTLFANHYARLALETRRRLHLGDGEIYRRTLRESVGDLLRQALLVAIGVAPIVAIIGLIPNIGSALAVTLSALWTLHWIVVEAWDAARVLELGTSRVQLDASDDKLPDPWFIRIFTRLAQPLPRISRPFSWTFITFCRRLARPWRGEIYMLEHHPWSAAGFSLSTLILLAVPVLNLVFRPLVTIGAAHLLKRLYDEVELENEVRIEAPSEGPTLGT